MAASGDAISVLPGTYRLIPFLTTAGTGGQYCIQDLGKNLAIFGDNANTVLQCYGSDSSSTTYRDANVFNMTNTSSVVSNLKIDFYPNRTNNYSNAIFGANSGRCTYRNIFVENKSATAWSYVYDNSNTVFNIYNSIFKSNGHSTTDYSGAPIYYNCLFDYTPSRGTKNSSLTRAITSNDWDITTTLSSDLTNAGDIAILNPDGTRSHIGTRGGLYAWGESPTVSFGGTVATAINLLNSSTIVVTTGAHAPSGTVDVTVTNPDTQSATLTGSYTYEAITCGTDTVSRNGLTYGTVVGADGRCWLDRNLGATRVATAYNDTQAYGWYFQWGRLVDGHQMTTSLTTATKSTSDVPGHSRYITTNPAGDWRSPQNDNLWQGVNGINNPCPTDFRLPTSLEWTTWANSSGVTNYTNAYNSSLKLTTNGLRHLTAGAFYQQGIQSIYWSSDVSGSNAVKVFMSSTAFIQNGDYRAWGYGVRCIMETPQTASLTTTSSTNITEHEATLTATITAIGQDNPERMIEWGTTTGVYTGSCSAGTGGTGAYSCNITNLTPNITYYYRAKATNSAGTSYGDELSFQTLGLSDITITDPDPAIMTNTVNDGYITIDNGSITDTAQATTTVNVTVQDGIFQVELPQDTQITGDGSFNFQNFTAQNVTQTTKQEQPTSRAAVEIGIPNEQLNFSEDITLQIYVGTAFNTMEMDILYQNDGDPTWYTHTTPTC
ncbi:MAG: hypothetical protein WC819_05545, partial [Parcubacteria group bacterium]